MTKTLAALLALAMLSAAPVSAATQVANSATSPLCGDDAAAGYKRPGGFCDQIDDLKSLTPAGQGTGCRPVADAGFRFDASTGLLLASMPVDPCCPHYSKLHGVDLPPEGVLVAVSCYTPR